MMQSPTVADLMAEMCVNMPRSHSHMAIFANFAKLNLKSLSNYVYMDSYLAHT